MKRIFTKLFVFGFALTGLTSCAKMPKTTDQDHTLSYTEIDGYKFHTEVYGDEALPAVIVIHGGPGGDYQYLKSLVPLSKNHRVIFYDQRGTGLSPRVDEETLTLESSLDDLHAIVQRFSNAKQVKLIGHSWGAMLASAYVSTYPDNISHAVMIEPGMLNPQAAETFVSKMKAYQGVSDMLALVRHLFAYPFVEKNDGHEGYDYVMTKLLNRNKPGAPYQCEGEAMPDNTFIRGGYGAFNNMLRPVMSDPKAFTYNLTKGIENYNGHLLMLSSECSAIGYEYQQAIHMQYLPKQTEHIMAKGMGHNMLTLNAQWSLPVLDEFLQQ